MKNVIQFPVNTATGKVPTFPKFPIISKDFPEISKDIRTLPNSTINTNSVSQFCTEIRHFFCNLLRWFETIFHFPFQLNFMKGLLVCCKRLLLFVDSRCCNNLSTYLLLYSHWHFGCHGNLTGPQIHSISSIQLHFTQKVVGELPFLLHQNCLHIKEHFLRKLKKILSRGFGATLIFCSIKVAPKPLDRIFLDFLKKCSLMCKQFWCNKKGSSPTTFCVKCKRMVNIGCIWASV